jgi:hypothetical protein
MKIGKDLELESNISSSTPPTFPSHKTVEIHSAYYSTAAVTAITKRGEIGL